MLAELICLAGQRTAGHVAPRATARNVNCGFRYKPKQLRVVVTRRIGCVD